VLFTGDGGKGFVYPNPAVRFRPRALRLLFPDLTKDEFESDKENIKPRWAEKIAEGRWRIVPKENGFGVVGTAPVEVVSRSATRTSVKERPEDDERTVVRPREPQPKPLADAQELAPVDVPVTGLSRIGLTLLGVFAVLLGIVLIVLWLGRSERASNSTNDNAQIATSNNSNAQSEVIVNSNIEPLPTTSPAEATSADESIDSNSNVGNANAEDPEAEKALLTISVTDDGVSLSVDGRSLGALFRSSSASLNLSPGRHFIRASKPGYKAWENTIYLNPQGRVTLPIELELLSDAAPVPTGPSPREQAELHRGSAEQFLNDGNLERAMSEVEQGLALAPDNPSLQSMRSRIYAAEKILARKNRLPTDNTTPLLKEVIPNNRELKVVGKPLTVCPDNVKAARKCDTVFVEVQVNEQGTVYSSRVISGPKELHSLALSAARQSRFQPALRNGQPVPSQTKLAFMFNPR
jgi:TonB family protein